MISRGTDQGQSSMAFAKVEPLKSSDTFVLVHGAWHGGWCWRPVAEYLRAAGHRVFTPTLTGLGERAHLVRADIALPLHVQDIVNVIRSEELTSIVLCGHSYGGMVITGVAGLARDAIRAMVYVDAFVPANGQSVVDMLPAQSVDGFVELLKDGLIQPPPLPLFTTDPAQEPWLRRRLTPHPMSSFQSPASGADALAHIARKVYVLAGRQPNPMSIQCAERAKADPLWEVESVDGGHDLMIDAPRELADILLRASG
jgi:pimeloyl-ACP methyl ester carboxylesterase